MGRVSEDACETGGRAPARSSKKLSERQGSKQKFDKRRSGELRKQIFQEIRDVDEKISGDGTVGEKADLGGTVERREECRRKS